MNLKITLSVVVLILCFAPGEADADRFAYKVGGSGISWSELATHWVAMDDTTVAGAIQPKELMPWDNLMVGEAPEDNLFGHQWHRAQTGLEFAGRELGLNPRIWSAGGSVPTNPAMLLIDGDETTGYQTVQVLPADEYNTHNTATGSAFSAGYRLDYNEALTFDLGTEVPVNRILFFPRQTGLDAFGVPNIRRAPQGFEVSIQREPEGRVISEYEPRPWGPLNTLILRTILNSQSIVDLKFPLQPTRFVRINTGIIHQNYSMAEFQVFGQGVPTRVDYVSGVIDLGEPVNFGEIDFALTRLRRTADGELIEDLAGPARFELQTRTGFDDSPQAYWVINEVGADVEVAESDYKRADLPKSCCVDLRLPGMQSAITDDDTQWTLWSSPYGQTGEQNRSADGRRYLQFRFNLETDDPLAYGRLDSLVFNYSSLLAQSVLGEVSIPEDPGLEVIEVPAGEERRFVIDIDTDFAAAGQTGFDAVRLDVPPDSRFVSLEMGASGESGSFVEVAPDSVREERTEIQIFFPSNRIDGANDRSVRVALDATLFNASTVFTGDVVDTRSENLPQSIEAGDADTQVMGNTLRVFAKQGTLPILADVEVIPGVLTPNGDGINDEAAITYRILSIESGDVETGIFDLQGRQVRELARSMQGQGSYVANWNGRDDSGRLVAPGIYMCRVVVNTESGDKAAVKLIPVAY